MLSKDILGIEKEKEDTYNILTPILRYRLLSYRITKAVPSMEFVITWVRKKTRQGFIHYISDKLKQGTSIRSLIMTVGKIDRVYV